MQAFYQSVGQFRCIQIRSVCKSTQGAHLTPLKSHLEHCPSRAFTMTVREDAEGWAGLRGGSRGLRLWEEHGTSLHKTAPLSLTVVEPDVAFQILRIVETRGPLASCSFLHLSPPRFHTYRSGFHHHTQHSGSDREETISPPLNPVATHLRVRD